MISDLKKPSYPADVISVDYKLVENILLERNIKIFHLIHNKNIKLRVPRHIELESDNDFWGAHDSACNKSNVRSSMVEISQK